MNIELHRLTFLYIWDFSVEICGKRVDRIRWMPRRSPTHPCEQEWNSLHSSGRVAVRTLLHLLLRIRCIQSCWNQTKDWPWHSNVLPCKRFTSGHYIPGNVGEISIFLLCYEPWTFEGQSELIDIPISSIWTSLSPGKVPKQVSREIQWDYWTNGQCVFFVLNETFSFCKYKYICCIFRGKLFDMYDFGDEDVGNIQVDAFPPRSLFQGFRKAAGVL